MINLATSLERLTEEEKATRFKAIDAQVLSELRMAGISILYHEKRCEGEVPTAVSGEFGNLRFFRAWYYWVVKGDISLKLARAMYAVPGRTDIRVAGHCMAPSPEAYADPPEDVFRFMYAKNIAEDPKYYERWEGYRTIDSYHIDTQEGLNFFVKCVELGKVPSETVSGYSGVPDSLG